VRKHWKRPATEWLTLEEMVQTKTRRAIVQRLSPQPKNRGRTNNCVPAPSSSVFVGKNDSVLNGSAEEEEEASILSRFATSSNLPCTLLSRHSFCFYAVLASLCAEMKPRCDLENQASCLVLAQV